MASKHRKLLGIEFWTFAPVGQVQPRYENQCWLWHDGRWLHKHFLRFRGTVYCVAWFAKRGRPHRMRPYVR